MKTVWDTATKTLGAELHKTDVSQLEKVLAIGRMLNGLGHPEGQPLMNAVGAVLAKFSAPAKAKPDDTTSPNKGGKRCRS